MPLGVYPDDDLGRALVSADRADLAIYGRHLAAFVASGKDCSILHDPATLLACQEPALFDLVEVEVTIDDTGWMHLTEQGCEELRCIGGDRTNCLERAITGWAKPPEGHPVRVRLSLGAEYAAIRERVVELLGVSI